MGNGPVCLKLAAADDPEVRNSFDQRCEAAREAVLCLIRQWRADEPYAVWAEVCLKAWRPYPRMDAEERAALTAGRESPHDWTAWLLKIAKNHLHDLHRRKKVREQAEQPGQKGAPNRPSPVVVLPLREDLVRLPPHLEPERYLVLHENWGVMNECIAALPAEERVALVPMLDRGVNEKKFAKRCKVTRRTLQRRRVQAFERLREYLGKRGYDDARNFRAA